MVLPHHGALSSQDCATISQNSGCAAQSIHHAPLTPDSRPPAPCTSAVNGAVLVTSGLSTFIHRSRHCTSDLPGTSLATATHVLPCRAMACSSGSR